MSLYGVKMDEVEQNLAENEPVIEGEPGEAEQESETAVAPENDEVVVSIGEESPSPEDDEAKAPEWVRELRKNHRELVKRNRELEEKLKEKEPASTTPVLGPKPTLEDCDYDAEAFEQKLTKWYEEKREFDQAKATAEAKAREESDAWNARLNSYQQAKASLKVKDFDDAEATVLSKLSATQQGIILQGAEKPEVLIYALGKNHTKLKELSEITDPVKYAFAVAKLETQLKVTPRKAPPPEKTVSGSASVSGSADSTLERLRAEAEKTGDRSKVVAYIRKQRQAA